MPRGSIVVYAFPASYLHPLRLLPVTVFHGAGLRRGGRAREIILRDDGTAAPEGERVRQGRGTGDPAGLQDQAAVLGRRQRRDPPGAEVKCHRAARHQVQRHDPRLQEEQDLLERYVASPSRGLAARARDDCACERCGWVAMLMSGKLLLLFAHM